jgi:membrane protein DedA with SNARE-associated domain
MGLKELTIYLIHTYGYWGLLTALALEFVGLPVPGEPLQIFVGFQISAGNMHFLLSFIFAFVGTNLGTYVAYFIGRFLGRGFILRYGKYIFLTADKLDKAEKLFSRFEIPLYLFGRYIIGIRHIVPYVAGIYKRDLKMFSIYNIIGSAIWCASLLAFGYFVGKQWLAVYRDMHRYYIRIIIASVIVIVLYFVIRRVVKKWILSKQQNKK